MELSIVIKLIAGLALLAVIFALMSDMSSNNWNLIESLKNMVIYK
jgi:hypothetical protein